MDGDDRAPAFSAIAASCSAGPCSPWSASSSICACRRRYAATFPVLTSFVSSVRSSSLRRTTYSFFTFTPPSSVIVTC